MSVYVEDVRDQPGHDVDQGAKLCALRSSFNSSRHLDTYKHKHKDGQSRRWKADKQGRGNFRFPRRVAVVGSERVLHVPRDA
jgi:hypothetical protein